MQHQPAMRAETLEAVRSPIADYLQMLHARYAPLADGAVATYIGELAKANPDWFGVCLVTADGAVYEAGDTHVPFTLQSISKPLTYGLVLEDHGEDAVRHRIGVEPSGDAFNSISLDPASGVPQNAMINAGAIVSASLVGARDGVEPVDRILATFARYAGRPLTIDQDVYRSESETGHRNRAIVHLLRNAGVVEDDPEAVVDRYFRQCSTVVDCRDLGLMAATLANGGLNPVTGERAASRETVRRLLSVMTSCGMYDFAGEWLYTVGIPAKSGVSGGILAVLPGQFGIGVFSPPLDSRGNSVRGVRVCQDVSRDFDVHLVQSAGRRVSPVRATHSLAERSSKRIRTEPERSALRTIGSRGLAFELQGELTFATAEEVIRDLVARSTSVDLLAIDLRRVSRLRRAAVPLLAELVRGYVASGVRVALSGVGEHDRLVEAIRAVVPDPGLVATFPELDLALEWCEDALLSETGAPGDSDEVALHDHELVRGLTPEQLATLAGVLHRRRFSRGSQVVRAGDEAEELFLISRGRLSVTLPLPGADRARRRLATASAGMVFGELAILGKERRTADVWADTDVDCFVLTAVDLERIGETDPPLTCVILGNLLRIVSRLARRTNDELALLAG